MTDVKQNFQSEIDNLRQIQKDVQKALMKRQQLDGQLNENSMVKEELDLLTSSNEVYKLIGTVLIKQDLVEARENVKKRMEYISAEIKRYEDQISDLNKNQETQCQKIEKLQKLMQESNVK